MKKEINIAETEWKVMNVIWQEPMLTIGDIKSRLSKTGWSDSTIKTLVRRLTQKGALCIDSSEGQFRYFPAVSETECQMKETKNLIDRIYHGSVKMLVSHLVTDSNLTESEAEQLIAIVSKMDEGQNK